MTERNLMMTLEHGLSNTWRLPRFSALQIDFKASANTFISTILAAEKREEILQHSNLLYSLTFLL
jgi:hypothetical protein